MDSNTQNINDIYKRVLIYFRDGQVDSTSIGIGTLLNSITTNQLGYPVNTNTCGCNYTNNNTTTTDNASCYDNYHASMLAYLKQMLGDANFYRDWMFTKLSDDECIVNTDLVDTLIKFIETFLDADYNLSGETTKGNCGCPTVDVDKNACNKATIQNYLKVLEWVKNDEIDANANKIKVYGSQFGELLPYLIF